jgi:hypothetical protein
MVTKPEPHDSANPSGQCHDCWPACEAMEDLRDEITAIVDAARVTPGSRIVVLLDVIGRRSWPSSWMRNPRPTTRTGMIGEVFSIVQWSHERHRA